LLTPDTVLEAMANALAWMQGMSVVFIQDTDVENEGHNEANASVQRPKISQNIWP